MEVLQHANVTISPELAVCQLAMAVVCINLGQWHCGMEVGDTALKLVNCYGKANFGDDQASRPAWMNLDTRVVCTDTVRLPHNRTHACIYDHLQIKDGGVTVAAQLEECTYASSMGTNRCGFHDRATFPAYVPMGWETIGELLGLFSGLCLLAAAIGACCGSCYVVGVVERWVKRLWRKSKTPGAPDGYAKLAEAEVEAATGPAPDL
jgi:hypothetical protein